MKSYIVFFLLFIAGFAACKKGHRGDCFKRYGKTVITERQLEEFHEVYLEDRIDLVLTKGAFNAARVETGDNLQDGIECSIQEGKLSIRNNNRCNLSRGLKERTTVYLTYTTINRLFYTGAGNISTTNAIRDSVFRFETQNGAGSIRLDVDVKVLYVALHTGPSDITVSGTTFDSFVYNAGNGYVHMEDTQSKYTFVNSISTGDCYVWATGTLDAQLRYLGNIYYKGTPAAVHFQRIGKGELKQL